MFLCCSPPPSSFSDLPHFFCSAVLPLHFPASPCFSAAPFLLFVFCFSAFSFVFLCSCFCLFAFRLLPFRSFASASAVLLFCFRFYSFAAHQRFNLQHVANSVQTTKPYNYSETKCQERRNLTSHTKQGENDAEQ